ncbi:hypothetical protein C8Q74DRAFT_1371464 [Fomes fomentarius]|nr:hypothetical protein C8Q74DRAFT_1371464 [Fomes fomentarius]
MSSSTSTATALNHEAHTSHDRAFMESIAKTLSMLASSNQSSSPLLMLSCVAEIKAKEETAQISSREVAQSATPEAYDGDTEDVTVTPLEEWPRFQSGERVRVLMGSGRNCWRYLTIADLRAHPPYLTHEGYCYPVLTQTMPRAISYIDSSRIIRIHPW